MSRSERTKRLRGLALAAEARERRHVIVELGTPVAAAWLRDHPQFPGAPPRPEPALSGEYIPWAPQSLEDIQAVLLRADVAMDQAREVHLAARRRQWARLHGNPITS